jgi:Fe-S-cluster-containing dehydrogenase component
MKKWNMIIDIEKCEDCNNCFLSCKDEHVENDWLPVSAAQPRHGHRWINILRKERGQYPLIDVAYRPTPCMHCDNAPCVEKSPKGSVYKRPDGIVIIDPVKAKGEKSITKTCPYGAIWWNEELELPQKCTFCAHLMDDGWDKPRCVQACPTGAIKSIKCTDSEMQAISQSESLEVLLPGEKSSPRVYYRNLYRFDKCFIAGSIAFNENDRIDCASGASVYLYKDKQENSKTIADNFGDFKFDNLDENGKYGIKITYKNYPERQIDVNLKTSLSIPDIVLNK